MSITELRVTEGVLKAADHPSMLAVPGKQEAHSCSPDRNCLSFWFPQIESAGLPVPKTHIFHSESLLDLLDGEEPPGLPALIHDLGAAGDALGWPCFLRTGQTAGKHVWLRTAFLPSPADIRQHVVALIEYSEMVSMIGLPARVWVIREMLPVRPLYHCRRYTGMPVVPEVRAFVDGPRVVYMNPYWPEGALEEGDPDNPNWRETYQQDHGITPEIAAECAALASRAGQAVGGRWSVDLLRTDRGWFLTDMAVVEHATWKWANNQKCDWPVLYDAGELGFCILNWSSGRWVNQWFDKAETLP